MIRQYKPFGCGLYAVANACNLPDFITPERLELSRVNGNTIGQLSKWLQEDGLPYYVEVLFYDHLGTKLPESAIGYKPEGEVNFLPVLMTCRQFESGLNHMIGGKIDKDGNLWLYDSLKKEPTLITLAALNILYYNIYGLFIVADVNTGDYAFI